MSSATFSRLFRQTLSKRSHPAKTLPDANYKEARKRNSHIHRRLDME
jgi:hypothetical protein